MLTSTLISTIRVYCGIRGNVGMMSKRKALLFVNGMYTVPATKKNERQGWEIVSGANMSSHRNQFPRLSLGIFLRDGDMAGILVHARRIKPLLACRRCRAAPRRADYKQTTIWRPRYCQAIPVGDVQLYVCPPPEPVVDAPDHCHMLLSTFMVRCHRDTADMLFELRSLLDHVLASKVMEGDHSVRHCHFEEQVLK